MLGSSRSSVASFSGDRMHYASYVDGPPISPCQSLESRASVEQPDRETNCPIRSLASQIDSCAKARVIALLAMEFLVFDGKLHGDRSNWACPFGDCKENFPQAKDLMRHVAGCSLFSGDKVYCNSCRKYDCFTLQDRDGHNQFCNAGHDAARAGQSPSSKRSKGLRKLTNLFCRGRPGPTSSSPGPGPGPHHVAIPSAASPRRPCSIGNMNPPTPEPYPQAYAVELGPGPEHEIGNSASRNFPDAATDVIPELPSTEPLVAGHPSHPSHLSPGSATNPSPMVSGCFTESPAEGVNARGAMPYWHMSSENEPASLQTISPNQIHSSWATSSPSDYSPLEMGAEQTASWGMVQQTPPPCGLASVPINPYMSFYDSTTSPQDDPWDGTSFAHQKQKSSTWSTPETFTTGQNRPSTPHQVRNGSEVPWPLNAYIPETGPGHAEAPLPFSPRGAESSPMLLSGLTPDCIPSSSSPPDEADEAHPPKCRYCEYRPGGKRENWRPYLKKHIHAKHSSQKVACADCGKEFSRQDNLKTHQKAACRRTRISVDGVQSRTPSRRAAKRPRLHMGTVT